MHTYQIQKATTNVSVELRIIDSTDGTPETGVVWNTAGIDLQYRRDGAASTAITEATLAALTTAHTDGGFLHIGNGVYRFDLPDAACATGVDKVVVHGIVTGMVVIGCVIQLVSYDPFDAVRLGLTSLPNAAADAAGGLATSTGGATGIDDLATLAAQTAMQTSVDGIGTAGGAAISVDAATSNEGGGITGVTSATTIIGTPTNTYTSTSVLDGTVHTMTHATNVLDVVYQFLAGGGTSPVQMVWHGYGTNNDVFTFSSWNHVGGVFEDIGNFTGNGGTTNATVNLNLFARHIGTSAAELGKVYIRIDSASTACVVNTDQLVVEYAVTSRSVGYAGGRIFLNTNVSNTNTEVYVDGVGENPVSAIAAAKTLSTSIPLQDFHIVNGSSFTLAESTVNESYFGDNWTLALGSQDITGVHSQGASVTGIGTATGPYDFSDGEVGAVTLDNDGNFHHVGLRDTFTVGQAGQFIFVDCYGKDDAGWILDYAALGATVVHLFNFNGDVTATNMATGDVLHATGSGIITTATCTAGTIEHGPGFSYTDAGGNVTEVITDIETDTRAILDDTGTSGVLLAATATSAQLVDDIYDEAESGHNVGGSFGRGFRQVKEGTVSAESTVNDAGASTTVFITNLTETTDDHYTDVSLVFIDGALVGQSRVILSYNGTTKTITLDEALTSAPADGSGFIIKTDHIHSVTQIQAGLATEAKQDIIDTTVDAILAMLDDPRAEPGQGAPAVNADMATKIDYLYKWTRNLKDNNGTTTNFYNDAGTVVDHKQTTSSAAGTVTKTEIVTGP